MKAKMKKIITPTVLLIAIILVSCAPVSTANSVGNVIATMTILPASPTPTSTIIPATPTIPPTATSTPRPRIKAGADLGFLKGMNYISWVPTNYSHPLSDLSLKSLAETGTKWVSIIVSGLQENRSSTKIDKFTFDDAGVIHVIQTAHQLGMNVMLKVSIGYTRETEGAWGGSLGEGFGPAEWDAWFASYTEMVLHYAKISTENNVEMICIGTELGRAQKQTEHFTKLIADVRRAFPGPVTYAADWTAPQTEWWDRVDYIGIDGYYQLTKKSSPSVKELETAWQPIVAQLETLSKKWNKPLIFTEIGFNAQEHSACNGGCGGNMERAELGKLDPQTQANAYQSLFNVFRDKKWFQGTFWWVWGDSPYGGGMCDPQYTPQRKLAENVLRAEYGAIPANLSYPAHLPVFDESKIVQFPIFTDQFGSVKPDLWGMIKMTPVTSPVFDGNQALKFNITNNGGGFSTFLPPLDTTPYQWLEFYIYTKSDMDVASINIFVGDQNWQEHYFTDLTRCNYLDNRSSLQGGQWNRVLIPLQEIAADKRILNSVSLSNGYPNLILPSFWIDNMRFVGLK